MLGLIEEFPYEGGGFPPCVHTIIIGGEACPQHVCDKWAANAAGSSLTLGSARHSTRLFNSYGPTEATISCTIAKLVAGEPVTIGSALPGYEISIRDEARPPPALLPFLYQDCHMLPWSS